MKTLSTNRVAVICICASVVFLSFTTRIQDIKPKEFMGEIKSNYEGLSSLQVTMDYYLYKGFSSDSLVQHYTSEYYRQDSKSYRKIANTEMISNDEFSLKISHDEKAIVVSDPTQVDLFDTDLEASMKLCSDITLIENEKGSLINMIIKEKTDVPFTLIQLQVSKDFWIEEMTLYYSTQIDFSDSYFSPDMDFPKLVIKYDGFKKKWKDKDDLLSSDRYLSKMGTDFNPSENLSGYQVMDFRAVNLPND